MFVVSSVAVTAAAVLFADLKSPAYVDDFIFCVSLFIGYTAYLLAYFGPKALLLLRGADLDSKYQVFYRSSALDKSASMKGGGGMSFLTKCEMQKRSARSQHQAIVIGRSSKAVLQPPNGISTKAENMMVPRSSSSVSCGYGGDKDKSNTAFGKIFSNSPVRMSLADPDVAVDLGHGIIREISDPRMDAALEQEIRRAVEHVLMRCSTAPNLSHLALNSPTSPTLPPHASSTTQLADLRDGGIKSPNVEPFQPFSPFEDRLVLNFSLSGNSSQRSQAERALAHSGFEMPTDRATPPPTPRLNRAGSSGDARGRLGSFFKLPSITFDQSARLPDMVPAKLTPHRKLTIDANCALAGTATTAPAAAATAVDPSASPNPNSNSNPNPNPNPVDTGRPQGDSESIRSSHVGSIRDFLSASVHRTLPWKISEVVGFGVIGIGSAPPKFAGTAMSRIESSGVGGGDDLDQRHHGSTHRHGRNTSTLVSNANANDDIVDRQLATLMEMDKGSSDLSCVHPDGDFNQYFVPSDNSLGDKTPSPVAKIISSFESIVRRGSVTAAALALQANDTTAASLSPSAAEGEGGVGEGCSLSDMEEQGGSNGGYASCTGSRDSNSVVCAGDERTM